MEEQIKELSNKIEQLDKKLDWMIARMWRAQSLRSLEPIKEVNSPSDNLSTPIQEPVFVGQNK